MNKGIKKSLRAGYLVKSPKPIGEGFVAPLLFKIMVDRLEYEPLNRWNLNGFPIFKKDNECVFAFLGRAEETEGQIMSLAIYTQDSSDTGVVTEGLLDGIRMERYPKIDSILEKLRLEDVHTERFSQQQ